MAATVEKLKAYSLLVFSQASNFQHICFQYWESSYMDTLYEIGYEYEFSIPVCRPYISFYIVASQCNLIPRTFFFTGKLHEGVRALETSLV